MTRGTVVILFVLGALFVAMIVASALGGVNWLIGIGGGGTALGTLGLAFFTYAMAQRTTELAASSQRLEVAATSELTAANEQARAATDTAREAQRTRIDALAPIVDLTVTFLNGFATPRNMPHSERAGSRLELSSHPGQEADLRDYDTSASINLRFTNLGRTPAAVTVKRSGAPFVDPPPLIRIEPGSFTELEASLSVEDPFKPVTIDYQFEIAGPMTSRQARDTIVWVGELRLVDWGPSRGWQRLALPLQLIDYDWNRNYTEPGDTGAQSE